MLILIISGLEFAKHLDPFAHLGSKIAEMSQLVHLFFEGPCRFLRSKQVFSPLSTSNLWYVSFNERIRNVIKHFSQTWQILSDRSLRNSRNGREDSWNSHFKRLPSLAHGVFRFPWKRPCFFVWRDSKRAVQFHQSIFADGLTVTRSLENAQTTGPRNSKLQIGRWPFSEVFFFRNQP